MLTAVSLFSPSFLPSISPTPPHYSSSASFQKKADLPGCQPNMACQVTVRRGTSPHIGCWTKQPSRGKEDPQSRQKHQKQSPIPRSTKASSYRACVQRVQVRPRPNTLVFASRCFQRLVWSWVLRLSCRPLMQRPSSFLIPKMCSAWA